MVARPLQGGMPASWVRQAASERLAHAHWLARISGRSTGGWRSVLSGEPVARAWAFGAQQEGWRAEAKPFWDWWMSWCVASKQGGDAVRRGLDFVRSLASGGRAALRASGGVSGVGANSNSHRNKASHAGWWRRLMATLASGVAALGIAGAALAAYAFAIADPDARLREGKARELTTLVDSSGRLIGLIDATNRLSSTDARNFGVQALRDDPPATYVAALLELEDQGYLTDEGFRLCGLNPLAMGGRFLKSRGTSMGSGLPAQLVKHLAQREQGWGKEQGFFSKAARVPQQMAEACLIHQRLGARGVVRGYAQFAPVWAGEGSVTGIEAAAQVLFGRKLTELSDAQIILLAAFPRKPPERLLPGHERIPCRYVYPQDGEHYRGRELEEAARGRARQCRAIARSRVAARGTLSGVRLRVALAELDGYERDGIHPVDILDRLRSNVSLVRSTASLLSPAAADRIRAELGELGVNAPARVQLGLEARRQASFGDRLQGATRALQGSAVARQGLCSPLMPTAAWQPAPGCALETHSTSQPARLLALSMQLGDGQISALSGESDALEQPLQLHSTAKVILAFAAASAGHSAESSWCPLQASDGIRRLRRGKMPTEGFPASACDQHSISLAKVLATSDNLAAYQLAKSLGEDRLRTMLAGLGLSPKSAGGESLAYALSFGTYQARPIDVLRAFQAIFARAFQVPVQSDPHLLLTTRTLSPVAPFVDKFIAAEAQINTLRTLLSAPVRDPEGTLVFAPKAQLRIIAGKTGSGQSSHRDATGRPLMSAKLVVALSAERPELHMFLAQQADAASPIALHWMPTAAFGGLLKAITTR